MFKTEPQGTLSFKGGQKTGSLPSQRSSWKTKWVESQMPSKGRIEFQKGGSVTEKVRSKIYLQHLARLRSFVTLLRTFLVEARRPGWRSDEEARRYRSVPIKCSEREGES